MLVFAEVQRMGAQGLDSEVGDGMGVSILFYSWSQRGNFQSFGSDEEAYIHRKIG